MRQHRLDDLRGVLALHDARRQLGRGDAWNDGLRARAGVAAPHAVDVQRRPQGDAFARAVARFAVRCARHVREEGRLVVGKRRRILALARRGRLGARVESLYCHAAVAAMQ
ncbi:hypothetical protein D3C85_1457320 [compost metagenome]